MRVHWTSNARVKLESIRRHIAKNEPVNAARVVRRLVLATRPLATAPAIGREVPRYGRESWRELIVSPYRIIYAITSTRVEIITVRHERRQLPERPEDL